MTRSLAALAGALALAACDAGGGGAAGGGTIITPTPTPAPTAPPPAYTRLGAMTGDLRFGTSCSLYAVHPGTPFPSAFETSNPGAGLTFGYTAATQTFSATQEGRAFTFEPQYRDPAAPAGTLVYNKPAGAGFDRLGITTLAAGGTSLEYAGGVALSSASLTNATDYLCVYGAQTRVADIPFGQTLTYSKTGLAGTAYLADITGIGPNYTLGHTTVTFSVDLSTLKVAVVIRLLATPSVAGLSDVVVGTINGLGDVDRLTGGIRGVWTSPDHDIHGTFSGNVFGPAGNEIALAYGMYGLSPSNGVLDFSSAGTIAGIR